MINEELCKAMNLDLNKIALGFPFTYYGILSRIMAKNVSTILDVGCGRGESTAILNHRNNFRILGLDGFMPYISECKKKGFYDNLILTDINKLPVKKKSFDIILCLQVIEHLPKEKGLELLMLMEELGKKQVIISTPMGVHRQEKYDGNPLQEHQSFWLPNDFKKYGYKVINQGFKPLYGEKDNVEFLGLASNIVSLLACFMHPLIQFFPKQAAQMICVKNLS